MATAFPKGLFSTELDQIASTFLKQGGALPNERELRHDLVRKGLAAAEALVLAPQVTFKVYGENVVLAVLAKSIGPNGIRELLEEGALEFILWQSFPTYWTSASKPAPIGIHPLAGMHLTSAAHCDPQASVELGLKGWAPWMLQSDAKVIGRLAADRTRVVDPNSGQIACSTVLTAYERGLLTAHGLDGSIAYDAMNEAQRATLAQVADDLHRVTVALGQELSLHNDDLAWSSLTTACKRVEAPQRALELTETILRIERLPSVAQLLLYGVLSHAEIPHLRRRPETQAFRKWLWSLPDPTNADAVTSAYLAALAPKVDMKERRWFKAARVSMIGVIGGALGTVAGGPVGGIAGAAIGTAVGVGASLADAFWLETLLTKPNPRRFATDVLLPRVAEQTNLPPLSVTSSRMASAKPIVAVDESRTVATAADVPAPAPSRRTVPPTPSERRSSDAKSRRDRNKKKAQRRARRNAQRKGR